MNWSCEHVNYEPLKPAESDEEYALHLAALGWSLADPIVITSRDDIKLQANCNGCPGRQGVIVAAQLGRFELPKLFFGQLKIVGARAFADFSSAQVEGNIKGVATFKQTCQVRTSIAE